MPPSSRVLEWLLEDDQPAIRYLTLSRLMGKSDNDIEVKDARAAITRRGWVSDILSRMDPGGWWISESDLYLPKYTSTNWMLLVLSDLGVSRDDVRVRTACDLWIRRFSRDDGGFDMEGSTSSELCLVGNTTRALVKMGYEDHPQVRSAIRLLVESQRPNGGWDCFGRDGVIDAWEGMSAFAAFPRQKWNRSMKKAVERGAEFYLSRSLYREGRRYEPWHRFHYPNHYYYDVLVGLGFMTELGFADDPRMKPALSIMKKKQTNDGRWLLEGVHPDSDEAKQYHARPTPFALEALGRPSKMLTLRALEVLKRVGD